jgi:hypothetical protein
MRITQSLWPIVGVLVLFCGCRPALESRVQGSVTLDNAPLQKGTVAFHPVQSGSTAYSSIQADGSYTIVTGTRGGLHPGEYVVTVVATGPPTGPKDFPAKLLTPARYQSVEKSPLRFTVRRGGNRIDLALKSK